MKLDVCTRCHKVLAIEGDQIKGRIKRYDMTDASEWWWKRRVHWCRECSELFERWVSPS